MKVEFACRYHSDTTHDDFSSMTERGWINKNLTAAEAAILTAAGIKLVSNWETSEGAMQKGFAEGVRAAREAHRQLVGCGGDPTAPIYFSHDLDPNGSDVNAVMRFLDGAATVLGLTRVGIYGGYGVVKRAFDENRAAWGWQTYAWSGGRWDPRAQIRQVRNGWFPGIDLDEAQVDHYGQWFYETARVEVDPSVVVVTPTPAVSPPTGGKLLTNLVYVNVGTSEAPQLCWAVFVSQFDERGIATHLEWCGPGGTNAAGRVDRYKAAGVPVATLSLDQVKSLSVDRLPSGDQLHEWTADDFASVG